MAYPARQIAEWFIARAGRERKSLTQMKLQKLVYIAHGWNLALYDEPLLIERAEAWKWGPVIRSLYRDFADYGSNPISATRPMPELDAQTNGLLERIWETYGKFTAVQLSAMTHADNTPWQSAFQRDRTEIISDDAIKTHYLELSSKK